MIENNKKKNNKMENLKIAIDLNGVIRDFYDKFHQMYCVYFGIDEEEFPLPELETTNLLDYYPAFENDKNRLYQFIFEEAALEIAANAQLTDQIIFGAMSMFNAEIHDEEHVLYICSREFNLSIGATYKFLGYHKCPINKVIFETNHDELWQHFDVIVTASPEVIKSKPENKIVVKIDATYNKDIEADLQYNTLLQLIGNPSDFLNKLDEIFDEK